MTNEEKAKAYDDALKRASIAYKDALKRASIAYKDALKRASIAYKDALKRASIAYKDEDRHLKATLEMIFPELNEVNNPYARLKNMIAWLDKYSIHNKDK